MMNIETRKEHEQDELRVYMVIRTDLCLSPGALASLAGRTTWHTLWSASILHSLRFAAYDKNMQPKIGLRIKNQSGLMRAFSEASASGLPVVEVCALPGVPGAVGIGPVRRNELPHWISKQQLIGDNAPDSNQNNIHGSEIGNENSLVVWLLVREDANIPYGKLVAQAGHGVWGVLGNQLSTNPELLKSWSDSGAAVGVLSIANLVDMRQAYKASLQAGLGACFIVDAGRTAFGGRATPTVVGIGPCRRCDLFNPLVFHNAIQPLR